MTGISDVICNKPSLGPLIKFLIECAPRKLLQYVLKYLPIGMNFDGIDEINLEEVHIDFRQYVFNTEKMKGEAIANACSDMKLTLVHFDQITVPDLMQRLPMN